MNEKPLYTQKAPDKSNVGVRVLALVFVVAVVIVLLFIASQLAYSGILTLIVFAVAAFLVHKLLSRTVFDITYALYDDKLVFVRKYGRLEWECEVFPFDEAKFYKNKIEHRGKVYTFNPDDKLQELLGL